ncbi:MAG: hypothetical protein IKO65_01730 [Victivallales bacterium]|nr:hypothetical protein [Victivallales bacterium]
MNKLIVINLLLLILLPLSATEYTCVFTPEGWKCEEWLQVKTPRWDELGAWVQTADHIENRVPAGLSADQLASCHEAYVSMVRKEPLTGDAVVSATMSFEKRYAPSIVLSGELATNSSCGDMAEYREHWEIVLYADGINVWHHEFRDGKPYWRLAAWLKHPFAPQTKYRLEVKIAFTAKVPLLTVSSDGQTFGCMLPTLPRVYRAGITACEGVNCFYDFQIHEKSAQ